MQRPDIAAIRYQVVRLSRPGGESIWERISYAEIASLLDYIEHLEADNNALKNKIYDLEYPEPIVDENSFHLAMMASHRN